MRRNYRDCDDFFFHAKIFPLFSKSFKIAGKTDPNHFEFRSRISAQDKNYSKCQQFKLNATDESGNILNHKNYGQSGNQTFSLVADMRFFIVFFHFFLFYKFYVDRSDCFFFFFIFRFFFSPLFFVWNFIFIKLYFFLRGFVLVFPNLSESHNSLELFSGSI